MNTVVSDTNMARMFKARRPLRSDTTLSTPVRGRSGNRNAGGAADHKDEIEEWMKARDISSLGTPITHADSPASSIASFKVTGGGIDVDAANAGRRGGTMSAANRRGPGNGKCKTICRILSVFTILKCKHSIIHITRVST